MTTEALRTVKDRFSEYVDRVEREHERVVVTRNGRPAIVLISTDDSPVSKRRSTCSPTPKRWPESVTPTPLSRAAMSCAVPRPFAAFVRAVGESAVRAGRRRTGCAAIAEDLAESVAHAVIDLITGPLLEDPCRMGRQLQHELVGVWRLAEAPIECSTASMTHATK